MSTICDHADAIHLGDRGFAEVAQSGICRLGATIPNHVAAIVGQVHDADTELEKNSDVAQFVFDRSPLLREGAFSNPRMSLKV